MKSYFAKTILSLLSCALMWIAVSCTDDEPQFNSTTGMTRIQDSYVPGAAARIEIWAYENLFAGYNKISLMIFDSITGKPLNDAQVQIKPMMDMHSMSHSCPVEQPANKATRDLFPAAVMFTMPSGDMGSWTLNIEVVNEQRGLSGNVTFPVEVAAKIPSAVMSFKTSTEQRYYMSYFFPDKVKVGVNNINVIIFTLKDHAFVPAENLTLTLTPEMPSMNHGSPNNQDPVHDHAGHYRGKVNFTMTGEWRLNLDLLEGSTPLGTKYFDLKVD